jgi:hypothetical protein
MQSFALGLTPRTRETYNPARLGAATHLPSSNDSIENYRNWLLPA